MRYGYIRSKQQSEDCLERQINALKQYELDEIVVEKSGEELDNLLDKLQDGDELYVESAERLTRNIYKLKEINSLVREKGSTLFISGKIFKVSPIVEECEDILNVIAK